MNTTSDPKEHTIRVRLNEEMYSHVLQESADGTISDYIRSLIQRDMYVRGIFQNPSKNKKPMKRSSNAQRNTWKRSNDHLLQHPAWIHAELSSVHADVCPGDLVFGNRDELMIDYRFGRDITLESAAEIFRDEYRNNIEFRKAASASVLSVLREMKGSHTDEEVAESVAERLFGDD